jgi:hypothetical protein
MCISLVTIYCINPGLLYFTQPLFSATILRPGHVCGVRCHACGVRAGFSNFPSGQAAAGWCLIARALPLCPLPHHHRDSRTTLLCAEQFWKERKSSVSCTGRYRRQTTTKSWPREKMADFGAKGKRSATFCSAYDIGIAFLTWLPILVRQQNTATWSGNWASIPSYSASYTPLQLHHTISILKS